jgi:hypothetical protein
MTHAFACYEPAANATSTSGVTATAATASNN